MQSSLMGAVLEEFVNGGCSARVLCKLAHAAARDMGTSLVSIGVLPTLTDAHVIRQTVRPEAFLGGKMEIDAAASAKVFEPIARHLGTSLEDAADSAVQLANANVVRAIQLINIHDLKQQIKHHDRKLTLSSSDAGVTDSLLAEHESLHGSFIDLEQTLQDIREDFARFTAKA